MVYQNEVIINLPRQKVIGLFDNPDNLKYWQEGFVSFELLSGDPGEIGAKSRLKYIMGKRDVELIETITKKDLPDEFSGTYEAKGIFNKIENHFYKIDANTTKWVAKNEFQFRGYMKLIGWLMPGAFKKQSQKYLDAFKAFAEGSIAS